MPHKEKLSWTKRCKNYIVFLLSFLILFIMVLVAYEIFDDHDNQTIALALIGVLSIIITGLTALLPLLLRHERRKMKKIDEDKPA